MPLAILNRTTTRERLRELGHRPLQQLGQNFLVDGNIVRKSVAMAQIQPGDKIVEIGAGLGTLTAGVLEAGAEVFAVERDRQLAGALRALLELDPELARRFHLLEADAVKAPLAGLPVAAGERVGNFKIVANLPYAISSPWLAAVLAGPLPVAMVLMLQRETAERLRAPVGTKQFGALSVSLRAAYRVAGFHPVPGSCFAPEPEVESALLHLELLPEPASLAKRTRSLLRQIFQKRRKQIGSIAKTLKAHPEMREWLSILEKRGVPPTMRPEAIAIPHWLELDRLCRGVDRG